VEPPKSVSAVVIDAEGRVLLHKREDFRIWSLPGGFFEEHESWEQAAVRETLEETGYVVAVGRLVGEYSQPQMPNGGEWKYVCVAQVVGGQPIERGAETVKVGWFSANALPGSLTSFMRTYIQDALSAGPEPVRRTLLMPRWKAVAIRGLIRLRNWRNRVLRRRK
jgi:8-oxo-dGTP diphosphatase